MGVFVWIKFWLRDDNAKIISCHGPSHLFQLPHLPRKGDHIAMPWLTPNYFPDLTVTRVNIGTGGVVLHADCDMEYKHHKAMSELIKGAAMMTAQLPDQYPAVIFEPSTNP